MADSDLETIVADTNAARKIHYQLRYRVFCLDTGFENPCNYPGGEETDEFDDHALHFLVRYRYSNNWIGGARLIPPNNGLLPIERHCDICRDSITKTHNIPFHRTGEVSRLLITKVSRRSSPYEFPSHRREPVRPSGGLGVSLDERRSKPAILRELIRGMAVCSLDRGITQWVFFVTPALARILRRMGIELDEVGAPCEYRGIRIPFVAKPDQIYRALTQQIEVNATASRRLPAYILFSDLGAAQTKNGVTSEVS